METTEWKNTVAIHIYDIVVITRIYKKLQVNFLKDKTWPKALNRNFINENTQTAKEHIHLVRIINSDQMKNANLNNIETTKHPLK